MNQELTKNIIVLVALLSIIIGFFIGVVDDTFFYATIGGIISHFYQATKVNELKKVVESQTVRIQTLDAVQKIRNNAR